jgi:shikimate kinase
MDNILLIGMPGAGKSTVGVILAKAMGLSFIDTDIILQEKSGRLLQEMIDTDGIEKFLEFEEKELLNQGFNRTVIATGGSVVYSEKLMKALKKSSITVYLDVPLPELKKRIKNISTRGIVIGKNQDFRDMYNERKPLYEKYSDIKIDCEFSSVEDIINEIIIRMKG